jgi:hypothetical protein
VAAVSESIDLGGGMSYTPDPDAEESRTLSRLDIAAQLGADATIRLYRLDGSHEDIIAKVERTEDGYRITPHAAG